MKTLSHHQKISSALILWFAFVLVACNLGNAPVSQPPTLLPNTTATPIPTLGFDGTGNEIVQLPSSIETPLASVEVELFNLTEQVDIGRLRNHVEALQGFTTRHVNSSTSRPDYGIGAARDYIYNQFAEIANTSEGRFAVQRLPFDMTHAGVPTRQENIVGVLQGTATGAGFIIVGAHYDSINTDFSDAVGFAPGANDNGSGVAGLIEMARVMSQRQYGSSIIFVAFSAEEVGRRGSLAFVDWASANNIDIAGMINIDSIGNNNRGSEVLNELRIFSCQQENNCNDAGLSRHMARSLEFLAFAQNAPVNMRVENTIDREGRFGDHFSFSEAGYPAIRVINALEEFGNGSTQDLSTAVEYPFLRQSVQSIMMMVIAFADGPPPPRNISLRIDATGAPTLIWEGVPQAARYVLTFRRPGSTIYDGILEVDSNIVTNADLFTDGEFEAVAIGTIGANGLIGRLSQDYILPN